LRGEKSPNQQKPLV
jgi:hypothetical protein